MKTILKSGQLVNITPEGWATLVKLIRKSHATTPPTETWVVRFADDETPVERDIEVKLPQKPGMASSLARSPESKNLLMFMAAAGLSDDWVDPPAHGVTAHINGRVLNNEVGAVELAGNRQVNEEILVHLDCTNFGSKLAKSKIILNLNTLLILASSYVRQQYDVATEAIQNSKPEIS